MEIKRIPFYANSGYIFLSPKTGYNRYVVGLSLNSSFSSNQYVAWLELVNVFPIDSIYGEYNSGGIALKGRGNSFNLPISVDNPYYEIPEDKYLYLTGPTSIKPVAGIFLYYEVSTASNIQRTLLGVGL